MSESLTSKSRVVEDDDIDSDTISFTSTAASEPQSEYALSEILDEGVTEEGEQFYLIKWSGYPLHRSTWEPTENLVTGFNETLQSWEEQKSKVAKGLAQPFDLDGFERECKAVRLTKQRRKAKRKVLRHRFGLSVSPEPTGDNDGSSRVEELLDGDEEEDDGPVVPSRRKQAANKAGAAIVNDKDKEKAKRSITEVRREDNSSEQGPKRRRTQQMFQNEDSDDSDTPLIDIGKKRAATQHNVAIPSGSASKPFEAASATTSIGSRKSAAPSSNPSRSGPQQRVSSSSQQTAESSKSRSENVTKSTSAATSSKAGKTVTSSTGKRTGSNIFANWAQPTKKYTRKGLDPAVTNEPNNKLFKTLSSTRRAHQRGRDEPAPDLTTLGVLDLATGTVIPPKAKGQTEQSIQEEPQRPDLGRVNPARARVQARLPATSDNTEKDTQARSSSAVITALKPGHFRVPATCHQWSRGYCPLSAEECAFEHRDTGVAGPHQYYVPPKFATPALTCWYWYYQDGNCALSNHNCKFAHWNTGLVAGKRGAPIEVAKPATVEEFLNPPKQLLQRKSSFTNKDKTCIFWKKGRCRYLGNECEFAHADTGVVADPPGSYRMKGYSAEGQTTPHPSKSAGGFDIPVGPKQHLSHFAPAISYPQPNFNPALQSHQPQNFSSGPLNVQTALSLKSVMGSTTGTSSPETQVKGKTTTAVKCVLGLPAKPGQDPIEAEVYLAGFDVGSKEKFLAEVGEPPRLEISHMILAEDFRDHCGQDKYALQAYGDIVSASPSFDEDIDLCIDTLANHVSGGLILHPKFTMVIYTIEQECWDFVTPKVLPLDEAALRFRIIAPLPEPLPSDATLHACDDKRDESEIVKTFRTLFNITFDLLFTWPGKEPTYLAKNAFLMFHPRYADEIDLLTRFLHALGVTVYHANVPGSWDYFCEHVHTGVLIFHPEMYFFGQIPKFHMMLRHKINMFRIGYTTDFSIKESDPEYTCVRLFPHGGIVFLTDDLIANHTQQALEFVEEFAKDTKHKPLRWKLATRPGLKNWLIKLMHKHEKEIFEDPGHALPKLYMLIHMEFCDYDQEDPWNPGHPGPGALLISEHPDHMPKFFELYEKDEKKAADYLMNYFAGFACYESPNYKRFIVVHTQENQEWKNQYKHLDFVTPEKYWARYRTMRAEH